MANEPEPSQSVMEGKGSYNKYAKLPGGGADLALPFWDKAVQTVAIEPNDKPVVIADYGSSQGKNSLVPMQVAIKVLRHRLGPDHPVSVFHIDQPSNDFNTLFELLDADPDRYAQALFAELKQRMRMQRVRLRRLWNVSEQFLLAATAQNLKRLVRFLAQRPPTLETQPG